MRRTIEIEGLGKRSYINAPLPPNSITIRHEIQTGETTIVETMTLNIGEWIMIGNVIDNYTGFEAAMEEFRETDS